MRKLLFLALVSSLASSFSALADPCPDTATSTLPFDVVFASGATGSYTPSAEGWTIHRETGDLSFDRDGCYLLCQRVLVNNKKNTLFNFIAVVPSVDVAKIHISKIGDKTDFTYYTTTFSEAGRNISLENAVFPNGSALMKGPIKYIETIEVIGGGKVAIKQCSYDVIILHIVQTPVVAKAGVKIDEFVKWSPALQIALAYTNIFKVNGVDRKELDFIVEIKP